MVKGPASLKIDKLEGLTERIRIGTTGKSYQMHKRWISKPVHTAAKLMASNKKGQQIQNGHGGERKATDKVKINICLEEAARRHKCVAALPQTKIRINQHGQQRVLSYSSGFGSRSRVSSVSCHYLYPRAFPALEHRRWPTSGCRIERPNAVLHVTCFASHFCCNANCSIINDKTHANKVVSLFWLNSQ